MLKLIALALIFAILILYLKSINSELALPLTIASGIILLGLVFEELSSVLNIINEIIELTGVDRELYLIIFKITAIGYLVEFGASTISDFGLKSLADKLVLAGKIIIFSVSLPIIYAIFNLLTGLLK